ncbi:MAG TPA: two-component regulator propeller domain-containing protein [Candidatus Acidoferrales bacterium]|nr:two-component regulator propeller domain-containing protein [Candidatus Acidoferrales bacterium]
MIPWLTRLTRRGLLTALLAGFASTTLPAATNSAWFTRVWQTDDGLPNNHVNGIAQGQDGYLWVATAAGLARFDGVHFTPFSYRNFSPGEDQNVKAILSSRTAGFWIVPQRGPVVGLDPDLSHTTAVTGNLPDSAPVGITEDGEGSLWLAYGQGVLYQIKNGQPRQITAQDGMPTTASIYSLTTDHAGEVWLSKGTLVGAFHDGKFIPLARFGTSKPRLAAARTNGVWIAAGTQLFKCDAQGGLQDFGVLKSDGPRIAATVVMEDRAGAVWIGTDSGGLFRYGAAGFEKIETSHPNIVSLAEDREGNIWAGTGGGGLDRISPRGVQLEGLGTGSSMAAIRSVCEDTNGGLWGVSQNGLVVVRTNEEWSVFFTNAPWNGIASCVTADRDGTIWIGTLNRKLYCWRTNDYTAWDLKAGLASHDIVALLPSKTGDLWIGESGLPAVQYLHAGQLLRIGLQGEFGKVSALAEDAAGNIWIGTFTGQLMRVEGDHQVDETLHTMGAEHPAIRCLYATPDGSLWIGYGGWGLGRLKDGHFTRIGVEQGLWDGHISQIVADNLGWFWFGSDHGIFKIQRQDLEEAMAGRMANVVPVSYGRNEGLFSLEADYDFQTVSACSRDGRLWIPMRQALAVVDPKILHNDLEPSPVLLTGVSMDGNAIAAYGTIGSTQSIVNLKTSQVRLHLPPAYHKLEFEFAAPSFTAPENIRFRYRLGGFDDDWVDAEARGNVVYSRLAAGEYNFRVEAANGNGPWKKARTSLALVIAPFVWQTWWFRLVALFVFTLCVIAVVRYASFRRLHQKLQALAQAAALDKERTRIARDLHDDLGGSLTQVKQLFELAIRNHAAPDKMSQYLQRGLAKTQHGIKSLDETVWAVNPHNDTLPDLIDYIGQSAVEFLHAADIRCRVDLPASPPGRTISAEARHNLFLVVKEALNNVVRHAHASEVRLQAAVTGEAMTLTITDNGRGFEQTPAIAQADGLRNMSQRMEEIGGQFRIESKPGAGTNISLVYFWSARRY